MGVIKAAIRTIKSPAKRSRPLEVDLNAFLQEALHEQAKSRPHNKRVRASRVSEDYSKRLAERALYRRLIDQTDIAQDGLRFIFYFSSSRYSQGQSLDWWRRKIDQEITRAKIRKETAKDAEE
jgi:hypothetical protein